MLKQAAHGFGTHDAATSATITAYWQTIADQIAGLLRQDQPKLLLTIDEFPLMCTGIIERDGLDLGRVSVNQLLAALRLWRDAGLKMLLTGSIGMAAIERRYQLNPFHLNDLPPFSVPPLGDREPEEARRFVEALVRGTPGLAGWTEAHTDALLHESVVHYPSFLQFAFLKLGTPPLPSPGEFEEIFATSIRPELDNPFLDQFDVRLNAYRALEDGIAGVACEILAHVVDAYPEPCPRAVLEAAVSTELDGFTLAEVFKLLREDGFLLERTHRDGAQVWRLSSALVLVWWKQRGLGRQR